MKNMTKLLIAGAYICFAGSAMAAGDVYISSDDRSDTRKVHFKISKKGEKRAVCRGKVKLGGQGKHFCKGLGKIKENTPLEIHLGRKKVTSCAKPLDYAPGADVIVSLTDREKSKAYQKCEVTVSSSSTMKK